MQKFKKKNTFIHIHTYYITWSNKTNKNKLSMIGKVLLPCGKFKYYIVLCFEVEEYNK